tara:strand:+ start:1071 stop:1400 length:330 start_codon:yes stop_codon:yes gene_type:complete
MTFFAELDNTLTVVQVLNGRPEDDGKELEICALSGRTYRQTYSDGSKRKNFAGKGYTYDKDRDAFISPKPFASWTLNDTTCLWEAPTTYPSDGKEYGWEESSKSWKDFS